MASGPAVVAWFVKVSVFHSVNSAPSGNSGSNPAWVWFIDRSEVETLCRNSNCRARGAAMPLRYMPQALAVNKFYIVKGVKMKCGVILP